jgi:hypothetical protein
MDTDVGIEISLSNSNEKVIISSDDEEISKYKWSKYTDRKRIIILTRIDGKKIQLQHLLLGLPKNKNQVVVHKNGNYFDKRRSNIEYTERKLMFTNKHLKNLPEDIDGQHPLFKNYKANKNGDIYNIITDKIIKGCITPNGYNSITLKYNNKSITKQAHIFIYECFNEIIEKGYEIDHIDTNKLNNNLENLQLLSISDHHKKTALDNPNTGKKAGLALSKAIIAINLITNEETSYNSLSEASLSIPSSTVTKICMVLKGKRKIHQGFTFKYIDTNDIIDNEIWVSLLNPLFKGIEISNFGRIKSKKGIITYGKIHSQYRRVSISQNAKAKNVFVHRLVCLAFHGSQPDLTYTVDHIDRNKINNNESNLRWASKKEQRRNASDIKIVQISDLSDNIIAIFETITDASLNLNIDSRLIKKKCESKSIYNDMKFEYI